MKFDPDKHHRRSIRLRGYDYASPGAYFLTFCVQHRQCLFGEVIDGVIQYDEASHMVGRWWAKLPERFPCIQLDAFVTMPNHFHGIVIITADTVVGADPRVCPPANLSTAQNPLPSKLSSHGGIDVGPAFENIGNDVKSIDEGAHVGPALDEGAHVGPALDEGAHVGAPLRDAGVELGRVVQWFKTMTTNEYIRGVKHHGWSPFDKRLWQRNYYENIIRDERMLQNIQRYIHNNPRRWQGDGLHPQNPTQW